MPELPEVEVVRRGLESEVAGREVTAVAVTGARTVRRQPPEAVVERLRGATLGRAGRVGKFLLVPLDDGAETLVVHLRMSGRLLLTTPDRPLARHTHAVLGLSDGRELRFVDPRTFGELFVAPTPPGGPGASPGVPAALAHLGPDPLSPGWSVAVLGRALAGRTARLKLLLMDQRFVAGIGNIYSDEALFRARLRFDRPAGTLSGEEVARLHRAVGTTLREAVQHRGSSLRDAQYVDLFGAPGAFQDRHRVYGREGQPCPRCGAPVRRIPLGGRSTFLCETCQGGSAPGRAGPVRLNRRCSSSG